MGLKVAVVGLAQATRHLVPWNKGWEVWGLAWDTDRYRYDRVFEMHDEKCMEHSDIPAYLDKLSGCAKVYTQEPLPIHNGVVYPFDQVDAVCGGWYESSVAYMVALAIAEGAEEIGVYGVLMRADEEYAYQRPNMAFLLGLAKGRGIKLHIPEPCTLLSYSGEFGFDGRYGKSK